MFAQAIRRTTAASQLSTVSGCSKRDRKPESPRSPGSSEKRCCRRVLQNVLGVCGVRYPPANEAAQPALLPPDHF